jgi:hypothetical protein
MGGCSDKALEVVNGGNGERSDIFLLQQPMLPAPAIDPALRASG